MSPPTPAPDLPPTPTPLIPKRYVVAVYRDERWIRPVEVVATSSESATAAVERNLHVVLDMDGWSRVDSDHDHGIESVVEGSS